MVDSDKKNEDEFYDGGEQEFDFNELNRNQTIPFTSTANNYVDTTDIQPTNTYEKLKHQYDESKPPATVLSVQADTEATELGDENPIVKFNKLKEEIDTIEKDIEFYSTHKELFKGEVSLEKSLEELKKLKQIANYIYTSENCEILKKIAEAQKSNNINLSTKKYNVLNKKIYDKLNEHLMNRISIINRLKADNPSNFSNIEYELYIAPDTVKVKQYTKMMEIKRAINSIENRIGEWNFEAKKRSIASVVYNIKNNLRLFDQDFQKEINEKMDALSKRIMEIKTGSQDFYENVNKAKLDDLYSGFTSSKDVEQVIFNTIAKMESLKNNHEESAFLSLKIKDLIEQQEKISITINENCGILDKLKENITKNVEVMKKNIEIINKKLK